jgi:hypothetical protein
MCTALVTRTVLLLEKAHYWGDTNPFECVHVLSVPLVSVGKPAGIGREIEDADGLLVRLPRKAVQEAPEIQPLQVVLVEIIDGMVEVEAINEAGNALHGEPPKKKPPSGKPGGGAGTNPTG